MNDNTVIPKPYDGQVLRYGPTIIIPIPEEWKTGAPNVATVTVVGVDHETGTITLDTSEPTAPDEPGKKCLCTGCVRMRTLEAARAAGDVEALYRIALGLHGDLEEVETSASYYEEIAAGRWPNAEEILRGWLLAIKEAKE